ncbi:MAG: ABC transporter ATP-binding protein [Clostridia bacterium]|nr:ABC transporter ATP-binding protein [Clostridia bacterium]
MLKTNDLSKTYFQGDEEIFAVKKCNIHIKEGEFVALMGSSGSGKTTLLKMCGGLLRPTSGTVSLNGKDIYKLSSSSASEFKRKEIGFVFQKFELLPFLTAKENIILPSLFDKNSFDKSYFEDLTGTLNISKRLDHFPSQLSGGEQQRVAIARALINNPNVILADEPTGNLDKKNAENIMELFTSSVKKYSKTLFLITHDNQIASFADRVLKIEDGNIY